MSLLGADYVGYLYLKSLPKKFLGGGGSRKNWEKSFFTVLDTFEDIFLKIRIFFCQDIKTVFG